MTLFERLAQKAAEHPQRLVLPEGTEPRTLQAADRIIADGLAQVILIGKKEEIMAKAAELSLKNIDKARTVDPDDRELTEPYAQLFFELRKKKGVSLEDARYTVKNPLSGLSYDQKRRCRLPGGRSSVYNRQCASRSFPGA